MFVSDAHRSRLRDRKSRACEHPLHGLFTGLRVFRALDGVSPVTGKLASPLL